MENLLKTAKQIQNEWNIFSAKLDDLYSIQPDHCAKFVIREESEKSGEISIQYLATSQDFRIHNLDRKSLSIEEGKKLGKWLCKMTSDLETEK